MTASPEAHDPDVADGDAPPAVLTLRRVNDLLGNLEEVLLAASLGTLIGVSIYFVIATKILHSNATWPYEVIRYMVFFVAMAGAALASQRQGMFNMDLVTQRFGGATRSVLRIVGALLVGFLCVLVIKAGLDMRRSAASMKEGHEIISEPQAMLALIVGFTLIGLHFVLHGAIEATYWLSGKVPPEPPRGGHA